MAIGYKVYRRRGEDSAMNYETRFSFIYSMLHVLSDLRTLAFFAQSDSRCRSAPKLANYSRCLLLTRGCKRGYLKTSLRLHKFNRRKD